MAFNDFQDLYTRAQRYASSTDLTSAKGFVNAAYREIVGEFGSNPTSATKTLTANDPSYSITTDFSIADLMRVQHIYYTTGGQQFRMEPLSFEEILELRNYAAVVTSPGNSMYYNINGIDNLEIYPTPIATDSLTIYYIAKPTALSSNGDTIPLTRIPDEYQYLVAVRAGAMLAEYEDPDSWISYTMGDLWEAGRADMRRYIRTHHGEQQQRIRVGYLNRMAWRRHSESQYFSGDRP